MPISQAGALNTTALVVPDLYVQIVPPQNLVINGVPTNVLGVVGTASWGPVNMPATVATMANYAQTFGPLLARKYDMGTAVAVAVQQGASNFRCVRVTDGTDSAFTLTLKGSAVTAVTITTPGTGYTAGSNVTAGGVVIGTALVTAGAVTGVTLNGVASTGGALTFVGGTGATGNGTIFGLVMTARYTGSLANAASFTLATASNGVGWKLTISVPGVGVEVFDNINQSSQTSSVWNDIQAAVNNGNSSRGPSQLMVASAAVNLGGPQGGTFTSGTNPSTAGTDGVTTITAAVLVGQDTVPRKGMYALRSQGVSVGMLTDADDSTQYANQVAFALSEGIYMIGTGPLGETIANAATAKATAGIDCYDFKLMFGDWVYWSDTVNLQTRLVSPQGFIAGRMANLSPQNSSLNKQIYGVVGTQKTGLPGSLQAGSYSSADLQNLALAGIDVIANPCPGGAYFGARIGHNSSSSAALHGDNYPRMTNYVAATLNAGMGIYVGDVINSNLFGQIRGTLLSFFKAMLQQGLLGTTDGSTPYSVICDTSNNPLSRTALGYVQADCQVQYQGINEFFIVNIEGGQTVQVSRQTTNAGQVT